MTRTLALAALLLLAAAPANARDGWQGHPVCDAARVADHEHWHGFVTNGEIK